MLTEELILELESEGGATKDRVVISEMVVPDVGRDLEEVLRVIDLGTTDPNLEGEFLSSLGSTRTAVTNPSEAGLVDPPHVIINVIPISLEGIELNVEELNHLPSELNPLSTAASELGLLSIPPA